MPISAAALAGIKSYGPRWKASINLRGQPRRLATPEKLVVGDCDVIRDSIVQDVRRFLAGPAKSKIAEEDVIMIDQAIDDLEMADDDPDELKLCLNTLYDRFDYARVCVAG